MKKQVRKTVCEDTKKITIIIRLLIKLWKSYV